MPKTPKRKNGIRPRRAASAAGLLVAVALLTLTPSVRYARAADAPAAPAPALPTGLIRLNTLGYLPSHGKKATIAAAVTMFRVVREVGGAVAFRGRVTGPIHDADTLEDVYLADFSALRTPGVYHLEAAGAGRSPSFRIAPDVYNDAYRTMMQGMYLWRCGTAVKALYNGVTYSHEACHLDDAYLDYVGGGNTRAESTRGWHDAGDYNKYTVNGAFSAGVLLLAWEQNSQRLRALRLPQPNTSPGLPDFLSEVRWEMDWLLTMQAPDGSVYQKVSTVNFGPAGPPEQEKTPRYFVPWGSPATADFVAVTAQAARILRPYDAPYADRCLTAARRSYAFLQGHPADHAPDQAAFHTGGYGTRDPDERLWAAAEMWETTGEAAALTDFETRARAVPDGQKIAADWGWGDVQNLGMLTYLFSARQGRDPALVSQIRTAVLATADGIVRTGGVGGYGRPLAGYYWGDNGGVALTGAVLQAANRLQPTPAYTETALDAISHLFGRNYYGRSFVTGLGADPPRHPHDRRSGLSTDSPAPGVPTWPGYLVGGAWPGPRDWVDVASRFQVNEIAINWNVALLYTLAGFIEAPPLKSPTRSEPRAAGKGRKV